VLGEVLVARIDLGLVAVRALHGAAQVVRHDRRRDPADVVQRSRVAPKPVGELLRPRRFRVRVVRAAEHRNEDLRFAQLAGRSIRDRYGLTRVINKELVAGRVRLA
jgi:hypothetical protein